MQYDSLTQMSSSSKEMGTFNHHLEQKPVSATPLVSEATLLPTFGRPEEEGAARYARLAKELNVESLVISLS